MYDLRQIMESQRAQQAHWYEKRTMTPQEKEDWTDQLLLGLYEEAGELARAVRTRTHVVPEREMAGNVCEEVVDVFKYLLAVADLHDISPQDIADRFVSKTAAVEQQFQQRELDLKGRKVLVTDLDGCVADIEPFVEHFGTYGTAQGGVELEHAKGRWYEAGEFLNLPPIPGAIDVLKEARAAGYLIAVITARPVWEHRRVRPDTVAWLEKHEVPHDIVVFDKDKYDALVKHVLPATVVTFIEDRDKHAIELAAHGIPVTLINKRYNQTLAAHEHIRRVDGWDDIRQQLAFKED